MPTVYVDTSVPSYLVAQPSWITPIARRQLVTCLFWNAHRARFRLVTSSHVLDEAVNGDAAEVCKRLQALASLQSVTFGEEADALAQKIARAAGLAGRAKEDALHVAVAATNAIEYLVTWNCKHLANPRILPKVWRACERAGYESPSICTPDAILRRVVYAPAASNRDRGLTAVLRPRIHPLID